MQFFFSFRNHPTFSHLNSKSFLIDRFSHATP